jgi:hypothetical protein
LPLLDKEKVYENYALQVITIGLPILVLTVLGSYLPS